MMAGWVKGIEIEVVVMGIRIGFKLSGEDGMG